MYLKRNSGNVLFLILLAVALFAALSYAVTQSSRSGGKDISDEDARLVASQIIQYATLMEQTVTRLRLSNGCRDTQISFAADSDGDGNWYDTDDDYHNPNAPSDFRCHVFHSEGGGIFANSTTPIETENYAYLFSGSHGVPNIGTPGNESPGSWCVDQPDRAGCAELIILLRTNRSAYCRKLNEVLEHNISPNPLDNWGGGVNYTTQFTGAYFATTGIGYRTEMHGRMSGCIETGTSPNGVYYFYHVLIPR